MQSRKRSPARSASSAEACIGPSASNAAAEEEEEEDEASKTRRMPSS